MIQRNQQNIKNNKEKCEHDYKNINHTLIGIPKLQMVAPTTYYLKCKICGEIVTVNKNEIENIGEFLHAFF